MKKIINLKSRIDTFVNSLNSFWVSEFSKTPSTLILPSHCTSPLNIICWFFTMLWFFFSVLILLFFWKKRKPTNSSAIELRKRRIFCRSLLYFQSFSRNTAKKAVWQQQFVVFFLCAFLIKKFCAEEENELFFRTYSL